MKQKSKTRAKRELCCRPCRRGERATSEYVLEVDGGAETDEVVLLGGRERFALEAVRVDLVEIVGAYVALDEVLLGDKVAQQRDVVRHAADHVVVQRLLHGFERARSIGSVRDQLADHRVVVDADLAALLDAAVAAHVGHGQRLLVGHEATDGRQAEVLVRIFGVDARLERPAVDFDVALLEKQAMTLGDADHLLHDVHAGDALGDGMLHLQACVHLQEVEVLLRVDEKLDGSF